jgi:uncharacterized Tic20 family protein
MLCHLTALLAITGLPLGHIIGPLVVWLLKKKAYPFVNEQGKESLNFQISMTIYTLVAALFIVYIKIGTFPVFILVIVNFILVIIASMNAYNGGTFRYPLSIRLIK